MYLAVFIGHEERQQFADLKLVFLHIEHLFLCQVTGLDDVGQFLFSSIDLQLCQQAAFSLLRQFVASRVGYSILTTVFYQLFLHQPMLAAAQVGFGLVEVGLRVEQVLQLTEADVVIVIVHQAVAEECHHRLFLICEIVIAQLAHKANLLVVVEQRSHLFLELSGRDCIVVQVFEPLVEQFEEFGTVKPRATWQLVHLIVLQTADDTSGDVEVVFVLHVAEFQQAAAHQGVDVGGKAQHADFVHVEMRGKVVVVYAARPFLHADAEQNGLALGDAVAVGQQANLRRCFEHELIAHFRVLRQLHHTLDGL